MPNVLTGPATHTSPETIFYGSGGPVWNAFVDAMERDEFPGQTHFEYGGVHFEHHDGTEQVDFASGAVGFIGVSVHGLHAALVRQKADQFGRGLTQPYESNARLFGQHHQAIDMFGSGSSTPVTLRGNLFMVPLTGLEATKLELSSEHLHGCGWDAQHNAARVIANWLSGNKIGDVQYDGLLVHTGQQQDVRGVAFWQGTLQRLER